MRRKSEEPGNARLPFTDWQKSWEPLSYFELLVIFDVRLFLLRISRENLFVASSTGLKLKEMEKEMDRKIFMVIFITQYWF